MELGLPLSQKQTLKLLMTPRLQQALKLLQMPSLELSQHIEQELLTNPLLEVDEETPEAASEGASADAPAERQDEASSPDETEFKTEQDINWSDYFDDGFEYADGARAEREDTEFFERTPVGRTTLLDDLTEQLHLLDLDEETAQIAEYLLGCLDDAGFLVVPLEEIATELAKSIESVEAALKKVQQLDPPGIGARDLPESLLIQLRLLERMDSLAARIVADHFAEFKQKQYQDIARALKVSPHDIQEAAREIATLNPRPGAQLALEDAPYVVPDLVLEKVDGAYVVSLSDGSVPRLRVSRKYREILQRGPEKRPESPGAAAGSEESLADAAARTAAGNGQAETRASTRNDELKFVQEKLKSANWLIQTIEQRRRTMIKVMESIVEAQIDFFEKGPHALHPLTLQDVAEKIGMHESTVSRVTTNKYAQTPRGVFPLKYFFSSGLDTESGQSVSSKMAMERIRELIEKEDKMKPLSDQKIAELLRKEGLIVARRTVAKYRERIGILSARFRKEF
jgi:RNA polymerase sigma-54 factor